MQAALHLDPRFDCIVVHRDAEAQEPRRRHDEVRAGAVAAGFHGQVVAVVPVCMTEAWLLLDEASIRRVAGHPSGTIPLHLPRPREVESLADAKRALREALEAAADVRGRRLARLRRDFGEHRRQLLEQLDLDGPVSDLPSWRRLVTDLTDASGDLSS